MSPIFVSHLAIFLLSLHRHCFFFHLAFRFADPIKDHVHFVLVQLQAQPARPYPIHSLQTPVSAWLTLPTECAFYWHIFLCL